jgi:hypothetical protein
MWQCKRCKTNNNNSSKKCHGKNCKGIREQTALELPTEIVKAKQEMEQTVYDFCSVCMKDQYFSKTIKKSFRQLWRCHGCHKTFMKIGKSKPKPEEVFT